MASLSVHALVIDPQAPTTVYAGTSGVNMGGVFVSTDGGASWTSASSGLPNQGVYALAIDPRAPTTVYAGTSGVGMGGVFVSTDGGASWTSASSGLPANQSLRALAIDPQTPAALYAGTDAGAFSAPAGVSITACKQNTEGAAIKDWSMTLTYPDLSTDIQKTLESGCITWMVTQPGEYTVTEEDRAGWTHQDATSVDFTVVSGGGPHSHTFVNRPPLVLWLPLTMR